MSYYHSETDEPVHSYFELSYANYLVIPRTALQSMPIEWQKRFIKCMEELDDVIDWRQDYEVIMRNEDGKIISITNDPLNDYERGRRRIILKSGIANV
jgi:hypothetical protein